MRKWILFSIIALGMLFVLAACTSSTPTPAAVTSTEAVVASTTATGGCVATNTDGADTIAIPAGTFKMGSLPSDPGAKAAEQPQHDVTLGCYNIYKKEVTNAQYAQCVATGACLPVQPRANTPTTHSSDIVFADYPVVGVDFNMASSYCAWAGGRLPTEAEWEYAARGTQPIEFPWGDATPACTLADSKGCFTPDNTQKVGSLSAGDSPFKVADMSGNAWEWVFDWYDAKYYSRSETTNPIGPATGFWKVVRGGGYNSVPDLLRAANRHAGDPYKPYYNVGFRCVANAPLTLPASYTPPLPDKHQFPNEDPVDGDDPITPGTDFVSFMFGAVNCPDGNGNNHILLSVIPPVASSMISFTADDQPYNCSWDANQGKFECIGPDSQSGNPFLTVATCLNAGGTEYCVQGFPVYKAQNCSNNQYPLELEYALGCPVNGQIEADFKSQPEIYWDKVTIGNGTPMNCSASLFHTIGCFGPDEQINGMYVFNLQGKDSSNIPYTASITTFPNPMCAPQASDFKGQLSIGCESFTDAYALLDYTTSAQGTPLLNIGGYDVGLMTLMGKTFGLVDHSLQGQTVPYSMGMDLNSLIYGTIAVPDCQPHDVSLSLDTHCSPTIGPVIDVTYGPTYLPAVVAVVDGTPYPWSPLVPDGNVMEIDLFPFQYGEPVEVTVCAGNTSNCKTDTIIGADCIAPDDGNFGYFPSCNLGTPTFEILWAGFDQLTELTVDGIAASCSSEPNKAVCSYPPSVQGPNIQIHLCLDNKCYDMTTGMAECTPPPTSCGCSLGGVDCINEKTIGFTVQTCSANPIALVAQSVTATDGITNFGCQLTNQVGQAYCAGAKPITAGNLHICFAQLGSQSQQCCTLTDFASKIPVCQAPPPESNGCSAYKTYETCMANGCTPVLNPASGDFDHCK